ncbi:MAG: hypothetical protein Phog2KO_25240 [Phototrophicaceae bacterium]
MTTLKNIIADITDIRSRHIPFILAWIASYGLAWFSIFFAQTYFSRAYPIVTFQVNINASWIPNVLIGLSFGLTLSLIQAWLIRERYGFVPLLWRSVTIFGSVLVGFSFPLYSYLSEVHQQWISFFIWFSFLNSLQAVVLFRVNRCAWLFALVGIIAGVVASFVIVSLPSNTYSAQEIATTRALWLGGLIQAIGTSIVIMYLMANPREGIVPKRDFNNLSKQLTQTRLTSLKFIILWTLPYFIAWAIFNVIWTVFFSYTGWGFVRSSYFIWLDSYDESLRIGMMIGLTIGITSAIIQTRLIKRFSNIKIHQWALVTIVGWAFAGIAFGYYGQSYANYDNTVSLENILLLTVWFTAPTLFQTLPIWLSIRHGWLWLCTGIVTTIIGVLIDSQIGRTVSGTRGFALAVAYDSSYFYVLVFGGLAYGIITGSVFVLLQSQPRYIDDIS